MNFMLPTRLIAIGGDRFSSIALHFRGDEAEQGAYLGLPTLAILAWSIKDARRSATSRFLIAATALAALVTLGTAIVWRGHTKLWLPWSLVARLPVFDNVLPARISLYLALGAAVLVSVWITQHRGFIRWVLPLLAIAALVPALWRPDYRSHPERWPFFTDGTYKICFPKGENLAMFPFGSEGNATLWQAETNFWYRMAGGYLKPDPPAASMADPVIKELTYTNDVITPAKILELARDEKVDRILSVEIYAAPNGTQMHRFGAVQLMGGVLISPGCGYPSLKKGVHPTPPHPPKG